MEARYPDGVPGYLARQLSERFIDECPTGWEAAREVRIFKKEEAARLGFQSHADVVLSAPDGRRIAIEFEISRADPVANHAKFVVAYGNKSLSARDTFISMVSPHIEPGRRRLASSFTRYMRSTGLSAFQVALLPTLTPGEVKDLNQDKEKARAFASHAACAELERALAVAEPRGIQRHRIHFAGDAAEVLVNCWSWNDEMAGGTSALWGHRAVRFFAVDPATRLFAPSKFCAFLPVRHEEGPLPPPGMTLQLYSELGEGDSRFDGHKARRHLTGRLGFRETRRLESRLADAWEQWCARLGSRLVLRQPVTWLLPPSWR